MKKDTYRGKSRPFRTGIRLNWYIFSLSLLFLIFWVIGFPGKSTLLSGSDFYSKIFFFLNPKIFRIVFLEGYIFSFLSSSVNEFSFIFLLSYLICIVTFALQVFCCLRLFFISYELSMKPFHYVSCLGLFPIISFFLVFVFIVKLASYQLEMRFRNRSKYESMYQEEKYDDPLLREFDEKNSSSRPITSEFGLKHYNRFFSERKKRDFLQDLYKKLDSKLS